MSEFIDDNKKNRAVRVTGINRAARGFREGVFKRFSHRFFGRGAWLKPKNAGKRAVSVCEAHIDRSTVSAFTARINIAIRSIQASHSSNKE